MFSMFGRTGAPTKGAVIVCMSKNERPPSEKESDEQKSRQFLRRSDRWHTVMTKKVASFFSTKNRVCHPSWRALAFFLNMALLRVNLALYTFALVLLRHFPVLQIPVTPSTQLVIMPVIMPVTCMFGTEVWAHITPLLRDLHWLRLPQRIEFKLATLVFCCLHGTAPQYLARKLHALCGRGSFPSILWRQGCWRACLDGRCSTTVVHAILIDSRRRLVSASTSALDVPPTRCVTVGDRSFSVAGPRVCNSLPPDITTSPSLSDWKRCCFNVISLTDCVTLTYFH